jgi:hypothetical protein
MTFSREFPTPPIQKEAADLIEEMLAALKLVQPVAYQIYAEAAEAVYAAIAKAEGR